MRTASMTTEAPSFVDKAHELIGLIEDHNIETDSKYSTYEIDGNTVMYGMPEYLADDCEKRYPYSSINFDTHIATISLKGGAGSLLVLEEQIIAERPTAGGVEACVYNITEGRIEHVGLGAALGGVAMSTVELSDFDTLLPNTQRVISDKFGEAVTTAVTLLDIQSSQQ